MSFADSNSAEWDIVVRVINAIAPISRSAKTAMDSLCDFNKQKI